MFLSFSKTLKKMSGFRIGAHFRLKGWSLLVFGIFILMFYLVYWSILAALWMIYGVCYLYYLIFQRHCISVQAKEQSRTSQHRARTHQEPRILCNRRNFIPQETQLRRQ